MVARMAINGILTKLPVSLQIIKSNYMFCANCGTQLIQDVKFCSRCGASVAGIPAPSTSHGVFVILMGKNIKFLPIWLRSTVILTILMTLFFGIAGSFSDGFWPPFIGMVMLAAILAVLITFFILWRKRGYVFNQPSEAASYPEDYSNLKGIGGWLIVVMLGLFYIGGVQLYQAYGDINTFSDGTVDKVSDPNFTNYIPGYRGTLTFEAIISTLLVLAAVYLVYLFFKTKKEFPKYYIIFLISAFVFLIVDFIIIQNFPDQVKSLMSATIDKQTTAIGQSVISSAIWISYMLKSKRVKATFVN